MNLLYFLVVLVISVSVLGEFGRFPFASPGSVSVIDITIVLLIVFWLIWYVQTKPRLKINKAIKIAGVFLIFTILSYFLSIMTIGKDAFIGGLYLIRIIVYGCFFYIVYFLSKPNLSELIKNVWIKVAVVFSLVGFIQLIWFPDFYHLSLLGFDPHIGRLTSSFLDPNFAGVFIALVLVVVVWNFHKNPLVYSLIFGLLFLALMLTFSRTGYLVFLTEFLIIGVLKSRKIMLIGILLFLTTLMMIPRISERIVGGLKVDVTASERLTSWQDGIEIWKLSPIYGVGYNNLRFYQNQLQNTKTTSFNGGRSGAGIDSSWLLILATTGLIGFLIFVFFWLYLAYRLISHQQYYPLAMVLGLFVGSWFINALFYPAILVLILSIIATIWDYH